MSIQNTHARRARQPEKLLVVLDPIRGVYWAREEAARLVFVRWIRRFL